MKTPISISPFNMEFNYDINNNCLELRPKLNSIKNLYNICLDILLY